MYLFATSILFMICIGFVSCNKTSKDNVVEPKKANLREIGEDSVVYLVLNSQEELNLINELTTDSNFQSMVDSVSTILDTLGIKTDRIKRIPIYYA